VRLSQKELADYLGVARASLSEATSEGHKCKGYPVRAWAIFDGGGRVAGYDVPERVMDGPSPASTKTKPANIDLGTVKKKLDVSGSDVAREALEERENPGGRTWADATAETAPKVTGQIGAATVAHRYAETVEKHPGLATDVFDLTAGLGMAGIGLAATNQEDEGRWWKVLASGLAGFLGMRVTRNALDQEGSDRVRRAQQKQMNAGDRQQTNELRGRQNRQLQGRQGGQRRQNQARQTSNGITVGGSDFNGRR